jgi:D-alanine transaminase
MIPGSTRSNPVTAPQNRIYVNGARLSPDEAKVRFDDRGFYFGDGGYEVLRVYEGRPFLLEDHLARLVRTLDGLEIPLPEPTDRIAALCRTLAEERGDGTIYLQVTRGAAPRAHVFPPGAVPTFIAYSAPAGRVPAALKLRSVPDDRWGRCHLKTLNLLANVLAKQAAVRAGADEGLFVREDGFVTEGTSSNAFLVRDGALRTHPANPRILGGITRAFVLKLAAERGIPVEERAWTLDDARTASELFMTGTTIEVAPVESLDGRRIGEGVPGPLTRQLQTLFQERRRIS